MNYDCDQFTFDPAVKSVFIWREKSEEPDYEAALDGKKSGLSSDLSRQLIRTNNIRYPQSN